MRHTGIILIFLFSGFCYAQNDSSNRDRTLEGVHLKSRCVVDTTLVLHRNKLLVTDTTHWNYEFVPGKETYLEVWLRSTFCDCRDCSFSHQVIIQLSAQNDINQLALSPKNTTWISCNSFMMKSAETNFSGILSITSAKKLDLEISRFVAGNPALKYDGIKIERVLK